MDFSIEKRIYYHDTDAGGVGETLILQSKTIWACVKRPVSDEINGGLKPTRIPDEFRSRIGLIPDK